MPTFAKAVVLLLAAAIHVSGDGIVRDAVSMLSRQHRLKQAERLAQTHALSSPAASQMVEKPVQPSATPVAISVQPKLEAVEEVDKKPEEQMASEVRPVQKASRSSTQPLRSRLAIFWPRVPKHEPQRTTMDVESQGHHFTKAGERRAKPEAETESETENEKEELAMLAA